TANLPRKESTRYPRAIQFGLVMDREKLDERIGQRVDLMWEKGFVAETDRLVEMGIRRGRTAQLALGYAQILKYRDGLMTEEEAKEDTKRATRQYARRQETWFSRDERIQWVSPKEDRLERVLRQLRERESSTND
ncbi:MAG: tRNA (adenosine(37)-N6)-dimethylallyltransferase MiaA, partial [Actinobacteria bacterium]|nr:tRNA (adenosine(37)-N6)-dimethylallyltransferase MiaA [Actinomycetota bacterium]